MSDIVEKNQHGREANECSKEKQPRSATNLLNREFKDTQCHKTHGQAISKENHFYRIHILGKNLGKSPIKRKTKGRDQHKQNASVYPFKKMFQNNSIQRRKYEILINSVLKAVDFCIVNRKQYLHVREDVHFKMMQSVAHNGVPFAFPSQTL